MQDLFILNLSVKLTAPEEDDPKRQGEKIQVEIHTCEDVKEGTSHFINVDLEQAPEVQMVSNVWNDFYNFIFLDQS